MLRPGDEHSEKCHHTMGRAGDAPAARSLVIPRMRNDRISPQSRQARPLLSLRLWVSLRPMTRAHVTLLGPCFKTGQVESLPQHHRLWALVSVDRTQPSTERIRAIIRPAHTGNIITKPGHASQLARTRTPQAAVSDILHSTDVVS